MNGYESEADKYFVTIASLCKNAITLFNLKCCLHRDAPQNSDQNFKVHQYDIKII